MKNYCSENEKILKKYERREKQGRIYLSEFFMKMYSTDISRNEMANGQQLPISARLFHGEKMREN